MVSETIVNIHAAKTNLSKLVALVEKGQQVTIARAGRPVVRLVAVGKNGRRKVLSSDSLLNISKYRLSGPKEKLTNLEIDRIVYGS